MKKIFTLLTAILVAFYAFSQVPEMMSFQAVIRNASGELVKNNAISMQISILKESEHGDAVYIETQTPTSNDNGLVTLEIGNGTPVSGTFNQIDWTTGLFFLKIETDLTGGTSYSIITTSQILSVPFAFYSRSAGTSGDAVKLSGDQSISGIKTFTGNIDANNNNISNVAAPLNAGDAVNKEYVDKLLERIKILEDSVFSVKDIDGNTYTTIKIGNRTWMVENLKTTKYNNGDEIPNVTEDNEWMSLTTGAYCWQLNDISNKNKYGALYNFYAVQDSRNLCPTGWHVSDDEDFGLLEIAVGMNVAIVINENDRGTDEGTKLKSRTIWIEEEAGTDSVGFSALPGGGRYYNGGSFYSEQIAAYFWITPETSATTAISRTIYGSKGAINRDRNANKANGMSVRCVRDISSLTP